MTRKCLACLTTVALDVHAWPSTAIDVVKTRIQVDPTLTRHGLFSGGRLIVAKEGPSALLTGFGPTAVGYFIQGGAKFAGYELWKKQFVTLAGDKDTAVRYRTAIYLGAASVGESVFVLT
jgi:solute carrier family 25 phosphate transporter 3